MFWAGCRIRLYRFPIIAFPSTENIPIVHNEDENCAVLCCRPWDTYLFVRFIPSNCKMLKKNQKNPFTFETNNNSNNKCYQALQPRHDKTNKMTVRPAKTQISLGIRPAWSEASLSAWRNLGFLASNWTHSGDWSDWADAQAELSLDWAHTHFVSFVMLWLKCGFKLSPFDLKWNWFLLLVWKL